MQDILQQIVYFFGHGFCHQYVERSLEAGGVYFCVCARCTGVYLGFILTLVIVGITAIWRHSKKSMGSPHGTPAAMPPAWVLVVCIILVVPLAVDGICSYAGLYVTTNLVRFITGYITGTGMGIVASGGLSGLLPRADPSQSIVDRPGKFIVILVASAAMGALFYVTYTALGVIASLLILVSLWFSVAVLILLIISTTRFWTGRRGWVKGRQDRIPNTLSGVSSPVCPCPVSLSPVTIVVLCLLAALAVLALCSLLASAWGAAWGAILAAIETGFSH